MLSSDSSLDPAAAVVERDGIEPPSERKAVAGLGGPVGVSVCRGWECLESK